MADKNKENGDGKSNGESPRRGNSEYDNFQRLLKQVLSVPKEDVDKRRRKEQQERRAG